MRESAASLLSMRSMGRGTAAGGGGAISAPIYPSTIAGAMVPLPIFDGEDLIA